MYPDVSLILRFWILIKKKKKFSSRIYLLILERGEERKNTLM